MSRKAWLNGLVIQVLRSTTIGIRNRYDRINMNQCDAAYLAGIVDGEGSISIGHQKDSRPRGADYYYLLLTITNTSEDLLTWVTSVTGRGNYYEKSRKGSLGKKRCYSWTARGWSAADVLKEIAPHMIVKQRKAELGIQFQDVKDSFSRNFRSTPESAKEELLSIREIFYATG